MRKEIAFTVAGVVGLMMAGSAQAAFLTLQFEPSDGMAGHDVITNCSSATIEDLCDGAQGYIQVSETLTAEKLVDGGGMDPFVTISGTIDADPIFRMFEEVTNETGFNWPEYIIKVNGSGVKFTGSASSNQYGAAEFVDDNTLRFYNGSTDVGETAEFMFRIEVPFNGTSFNFCFQQGPVPEPASLGLIGLGAMGLLRRRK